MDLKEQVRDAIINGESAPNGGSDYFTDNQWLCIIRNNLLQINKDLTRAAYIIILLLAVILWRIW